MPPAYSFTDVQSPAEALIAAALRSRMNWSRSVVPRLARFRDQFPGVKSIEELYDLVAPLSEAEVAAQVLGIAYNTPANRRPAMLKDLVLAFISYRSEEAPDLADDKWLRHWAMTTPDHPHNWISAVQGVGAGTLEWLRVTLALQARAANPEA